MNFETYRNTTILLLGKPRSLSRDEFEKLLKLHGMQCVDRFEEGIALIVEGRMMNPYEQSESARLYEEYDAPIVAIDPLEEWLCRSIEPNRLLMSLKLSRDQDRLVAFLQNPYITDELYFKLLALYDWQKEGLFDNDRNRDVTASIIGRFYRDLDRNHNVQYAMSGLAHLIERYGTGELISAIAALSPIAKELNDPQDRSLGGVLDAMALHDETPGEVLRKLLPTRAELLARREPLVLEEELIALGTVDEIVSQNPTLSLSGIEKLMGRFASQIARYARLDTNLFERLLGENGMALAANPTLDISMQETLMGRDDEALKNALASNPSLDPKFAEALMQVGHFGIALASNPSLSSENLTKLYESNDAEIHAHLAANPSTPVELLYQLALDRRFERSVKTNPAFGKHIQTHNIGWL